MSDASRPTFDDKYYDEAYFDTGSKTYRTVNGKTRKWGYIKSSTIGWEGWKAIAPALVKIFNPKRAIDVGAGTGTLLPYLLPLVETWGIDFSRYAVTHPFKGARGILFQADARFIPFVDKCFDLVLVYDLMEHVYEDDLDRVISELRRICSKHVFFNIGSIMRGDGNYFRLKKGEIPPLMYEGTAVAGHVNVSPPTYWIQKLTNKEWKLKPDLEFQFRQMVNPAIIKNWNLIIVTERTVE